MIEVDLAAYGKLNLDSILNYLFRLNINTVMVEGGREIITSFIMENLVDKVVVTISPIFIGGISVLSQEINKALAFPRLKNIIQYKLGNDIIITGEVERKIS